MERFDGAAVRYFQEVLKKPEMREYFRRFRGHHPETARHSYRVGILCVELGMMNSVDREQLRFLAEAGALHDVGKLHIPASLLDKAEKPTPKEKAILESHPRFGFQELTWYQPKIVRRIVVAHHEFQNHAYPRNDFGVRVEMPAQAENRKRDPVVDRLAQIVGAADMYDAGLNWRTYKPRLPEANVIEYMQREYTGDQQLVEQLGGSCGVVIEKR